MVDRSHDTLLYQIVLRCIIAVIGFSWHAEDKTVVQGLTTISRLNLDTTKRVPFGITLNYISFLVFRSTSYLSKSECWLSFVVQNTFIFGVTFVLDFKHQKKKQLRRLASGEIILRRSPYFAFRSGARWNRFQAFSCGALLFSMLRFLYLWRNSEPLIFVLLCSTECVVTAYKNHASFRLLYVICYFSSNFDGMLDFSSTAE